MKAIIYEKYGPPDVLKVTDVEKPQPEDGEVLVKVHAASLNFGDNVLLRGKPLIGRLWSGPFKPKYKILGTDIAGQVEAVGGNVRELKVGDAVFGDISQHGFGAFTEYAAVPENVLALKPDNITFEQAASVPQAAVVALQGLRTKGNIQAGQKVLVNGASGGVGTFAVQIAKSFDCQVTGVCSSRHSDLVRSIGADHVIDYIREDFTQGDQKYDLVLDIVANRSVADYKRSLNAKGTYVAVAFNATSLFLGPLLSKKDGIKVRSLSALPNLDDLVYVRDLLEAKKVIPIIDKQFSLAEVPQAFDYVEKEKHHGKVIIRVSANDD